MFTKQYQRPIIKNKKKTLLNNKVCAEMLE